MMVQALSLGLLDKLLVPLMTTVHSYRYKIRVSMSEYTVKVHVGLVHPAAGFDPLLIQFMIKMFSH